jgi:hypothetical protein
LDALTLEVATAQHEIADANLMILVHGATAVAASANLKVAKLVGLGARNVKP